MEIYLKEGAGVRTTEELRAIQSRYKEEAYYAEELLGVARQVNQTLAIMRKTFNKEATNRPFIDHENSLVYTLIQICTAQTHFNEFFRNFEDGLYFYKPSEYPDCPYRLIANILLNDLGRCATTVKFLMNLAVQNKMDSVDEYGNPVSFLLKELKIQKG